MNQSKSMKILNIIDRIVKYFTRVKSTGRWFVGIGLGLIAANAIGLIVSATIPFNAFSVPFSFTYGDTGAPIGTLLGLFLIAVGVPIELYVFWSDLQTRKKQKILVVELRGLRKETGAPLVDALPADLNGTPSQILINLTQSKDGEISDPDEALKRVETIPLQLEQNYNGLDRSNIMKVFGGLAPVPFTFLTGVLLDDESPLLFLDWDRFTTKWRPLDDDDDGERFEISKSGEIGANDREIALLVSVSYPINIDDVRSKVEDMPLVQLKLKDGNFQSHWSEEKQAALAEQFLTTIKGFLEQDIDRIHLFMASPSSLVARFGNCYDKRNLPEIIVYQYKKNGTPLYPWAVRMPTSGKMAQIIQ